MIIYIKNLNEILLDHLQFVVLVAVVVRLSVMSDSL